MFDWLLRREQAELVAVAMLYCHSVDDGIAIRNDAGRISDLGFAGVAGGEILKRPPTTDNPRIDGWIATKYLAMKQESGPGTLGTAELREALAHDDMMRGEIDLTGVQLTIYLRSSRSRHIRGSSATR